MSAELMSDFFSAMDDICSVNYTADPDEWFLLLQIRYILGGITPPLPIHALLLFDLP